MKTYYNIVLLFFATTMGFAQMYQFGIVHNTDHNFKIVAIPDIASAGQTDVSNIGFTLMLPAGAADVINATSALAGRTWSVQEVPAATIVGALPANDGTRDAFLMTIPPGQSFISHGAGEQIDLVSFDIATMPEAGMLEILLNSDPINAAFGGALESFYQANVDMTTTQNYFAGLAPGLDNFMFDTLGVEEDVLTDTSISIYPNPASKFVNISSDLDIELVEMFDLLGKLVLTTEETNQIRVDQLPAGVYLIKIYAMEGQLTKKVIIE